mmetsp:Transcript_45598/g.97430  ORF Transcript_45598/g.97430 Transcript_45598/m.97430 type:complete len:237 (+) Transcript_45598:929-1639(+)
MAGMERYNALRHGTLRHPARRHREPSQHSHVQLPYREPSALVSDDHRPRDEPRVQHPHSQPELEDPHLCSLVDLLHRASALGTAVVRYRGAAQGPGDAGSSWPALVALGMAAAPGVAERCVPRGPTEAPRTGCHLPPAGDEGGEVEEERRWERSPEEGAGGLPWLVPVAHLPWGHPHDLGDVGADQCGPYHRAGQRRAHVPETGGPCGALALAHAALDAALDPGGHPQLLVPLRRL